MKTIKIFAYALAIISGFVFTSCGSDDGGNSLPDIGGYNSADEVAAADLVAYFPLDGNGKEDISGSNPSATQGTTWVEGAKGQAANFTNGFLKYSPLANFPTTMNGFTISAWIKVNNNKTETTGTASTIFSMGRANEWGGNMNLYVETGAYTVASDSLKFKGGYATTANGMQIYENFIKLDPWMVEENAVTPGKHVAGPNKVAGTWAHAVFTWDGTSKTFTLYSNGAKISSPAFEVRGDATSLTFDSPTFPMIGAFGNHETTTDSWNKPMTGQVDEVRIFKKALTPADINALYLLEKAGR